MKNKLLRSALIVGSLGLSASASAITLSEIWDILVSSSTQVGFTGTVGNQAYSRPGSLAGQSGQIRVMAANIKGFPEGLQGISDGQASLFSSTYIAGQAYDIVGLQENWVRNYAVMSPLSQTEYPYRSDHFQGGVFSFGDGLSTISKHPINGRQLHVEYSSCKGTYSDFIANGSSPDCETEKGFTFTEVQLAKDLKVHFYNTHMDTSNGQEKTGQFNQLKHFIQQNSAGYPVIVMGDFNAWIDNGGWQPGPNQSELGRWASELGLTWSCSQVSYAAGNTNINDVKGPCKGVDHIAFRGNSQISFFTNRYDEVHQSISDHNPITATLSWTNHAAAYSSTYARAHTASLLNTHHNTRIQAVYGGNDEAKNMPAAAAEWETFTLALEQKGNTQQWVDHRCIQSGDTVSLRAHNGHYLRATPHNNHNVDVRASVLLGWEKFVLYNHSNGWACLNQNDKITLKTAHGKYVMADANRNLSASDNQLAWEFFKVELGR
ncbi:endonuclease/exonuclease/phosphatase family protein [Microbulbifer sp. TRSA005]|uniref:endonuclease/exonuclease/phosphatase family protein n=1 Tax=Microbulbifer sp. TRSA005 TaxID=3243383 RepID=UPI0040397648